MLDFAVDLTPEESKLIQFAKQTLWDVLNDISVTDLSDVDIELFGILSQDSAVDS